MEFAGDFETHLTVPLNDSNSFERLRLWARERNLKFVQIILDRGETLSQPMLTRCGRGKLSVELAAARLLKSELEAADFTVKRIKIEAAVWNEDIPQCESDAAAINGYFEHHIKLRLKLNQNLSDLRRLAENHSAHLSRNAFKRTREDGFEERFVTQRCKSVGRVEAQKQLDQLIVAINSAGYRIIKTEQEFTVYDDNLAIDAGWI